MKAIIPEIGTRFGHLTVIDNTARLYKHNVLACVCKCDCGQIVTVQNYYLRHGICKSCGCHTGKYRSPYKGATGENGTRLYNIWINMLARCNNPNDKGYKNWGARGIKVCDEWGNSFFPFKEWALSNGYSDKLTLDRIDVNGNYEPSNCRWVDMKTQQNNKRNNRLITFNGKTQTEAMWAEETGIGSTTIQVRLDNLGWDVERALTEPVQRRTKKNNMKEDKTA